MIFTESTIKISNNVSKMDSTIVLYRGDKNVEIRFTILQSPFKYSNTVATNVIESTNASYGQLVIKTPNDKPPIFSEVSATKEGTVLFTITKEMIDEIEELGNYTFQIRLMDENKQSRVTIPPVENGIEIKEPIAIEDDNTTNVVGLAKANYAVATSSDVDTPTFDDNGKYNKTNWNDGDIITNVSLNKIEDGIYTTNENVTATKKYVDNGINYNNKQFNNRIVAMNISKHPVSCSTEIYKKPLCDIFPELLNITYNTVFKGFNSFKVNMDNFAKEYPTVKSAYNKLNINLYDENDNSIGNSYGKSINGEGLNIIFINITESLRFYAYFDKALVNGSGTTMETKNGYMTIQLLIPKGNNKQEFIDKIKNLKLTLSVFRTDFLNLNNETIYTPTTDYNPATKKYVDDNTPIKSLPVNPTTSTSAMVDVNNLTVSGCYALPKRSDGKDWTNLIMRAIINDGSGKGKAIILSGYQNYVFHVNLETKKIYCDNLRIVYNIGTTADTTDIRTEPYYLPTTNTKEFTPTKEYHPATKKYVDDNIKTTINSVKGDLGTEELTTTAKDLRGAVNELNTQYKDVVNKHDYINIESFRKINSPNANDTEMFTDAFTYCKNNKKNLLIDAKEYIINCDTIVYDGSFSIKGINRQQSILKCANEGEIFINTDKTTKVREGIIENITIDGDFKINTVVVLNGKKNIIRNSLIKNGKQSVLKLGDEFNCWENEISKCILMGCENESVLSPDNVVTFTEHATDNYMSDTIIQNSTEICLLDSGSNNRFYNIHIYGYPNEKRPKMCVKLNGSNSWLFNTQLDTPTECGILVTGYNNIITSNTCFWNTAFPSTGTEHFVTLDNLNTKRCSNNIITSNIVTYSGTKLSNVINILGDDVNNVIESNNGNISNDNGNKFFIHPNNYVVVNRKNKWYNPLGVDRYELNVNKPITLQNSWTPFETNELVIAFKNELGQYVLSGRIANGLEDANTVIFNLAHISKNALPKRYLSYPITYRTKNDEYKVAELGISSGGDVTIHGVSNCKYIMLNNIIILNN